MLCIYNEETLKTMSMKLNIQKWGNSAAVRLPTSMLAQMGVRVGDSFEVDVAQGEATLRAAKPKYKLADLMAQCDLTAPMPDDVAAWDYAAPVGREVV
jgi:antitoxin ChpS